MTKDRWRLLGARSIAASRELDAKNDQACSE